MISTDDITALAALARIEVGSDELPGLASDIESILGYIDRITAVTVPEGVIETYQDGYTVNVMRADEQATNPRTYTDAALANAPATEDEFIIVPKVL